LSHGAAVEFSRDAVENDQGQPSARRESQLEKSVCQPQNREIARHQTPLILQIIALDPFNRPHSLENKHTRQRQLTVNNTRPTRNRFYREIHQRRGKLDYFKARLLLLVHSIEMFIQTLASILKFCYKSRQ
jgi:hypothetical protein